MSNLDELRKREKALLRVAVALGQHDDSMGGLASPTANEGMNAKMGALRDAAFAYYEVWKDVAPKEE